MSVAVLQADAAHLPLPGRSVDLIVTSPPYFAMRSYQDGGEHYTGQIGSEATPAEFLDALWACTAEWMRVLKPAGSLWVNLGDKYANDGKWGGTSGQRHLADRPEMGFRGKRTSGMPAKSLMGLPWRYAIGCIDRLGLILRAEVIWAKPNGLPESVTDRVRRSHEQWFHFVQQPRYFSAVDEIREPHTGGSHEAGPRAAVQSWESGHGVQHRTGRTDKALFNPAGKLPGSVWTVPSEPLIAPAHLGIDHFAAFPTEWPRRIVQGWSPSGICTACGEGRRPTSTRVLGADRGGRKWNVLTPDSTTARLGFESHYEITGEACACPTLDAPTRPSVVLDPFGGTGTTALVADVLGRTGISVDLSHDYGRLARWRTTDPRQRAGAMRVDKPEPVMAGQSDLFSEMPA